MREEASLKAGNYAVLDTAGGWRVLCRSRLSAERYCTYELATIETGSQVRVPGHIRKGDRIKIRVEDGEFRGRV